MTFNIRTFFGVITALIVIGLIAFLTQIKYDQLVKDLEKKQAEKLFTLSNHFEYRIAERELILDITSDQIIKNHLLEHPQSINTLLDKNLSIRPDLAGFLVTSPDGDYIASSGNIKAEKTPNLLQHPKTKASFEQTLASKKMTIGQNYYFQPIKSWVIPFRKAIRVDDKVIAVISTGMNLKNIRNEIDTTLIKGSNIRIINDHNNYRIFASDDEKIGFEKTYNETIPKTIFKAINNEFTKRYQYNIEEAKRHLATKPLIANTNNAQGILVLASLMYMPKYGYWLIVETPVTEVYTKLFKEIFVYLAFLFITLLLLGYFSYLLRKKEQQTIQTLEFKAEHDSLTGLPNRYYLENQFRNQVDMAKSSISLLFIDLDNFKNVNDTFGHHIGDKLLIQVAERLKQQLSANSDVIRFGGDEFVVLLVDKHIYDVELAQQIIQTISVSYIIDQLNFTIGASIGLARASADKADLNTLLSQADLAMYEAKKRKNSVEVFSESLRQSSIKHTQMELQLRQAIVNQEIYLNYQPQIDREGRFYGVECLVRWQNEDLGFVPPNEFIKVAEDIGLMPELGHYITKTSLKQMAELQSELNQEFQVSINISLKQFSQAYFFEEFIKIAEKSGVKLANITIEVTESLFIEDLDFILGILYNFRKKGVSISLDDFGTGFSSLSLLRQLPIQELKIDKAFVDDILTDDKDATLINNIIQIANDLGMYTVAEGVETIEQKNKLTSYGCILYQGYYFAKPMSVSDLKKFVQDLNSHND